MKTILKNLFPVVSAVGLLLPMTAQADTASDFEGMKSAVKRGDFAAAITYADALLASDPSNQSLIKMRAQFRANLPAFSAGPDEKIYAGMIGDRIADFALAWNDEDRTVAGKYRLAAAGTGKLEGSNSEEGKLQLTLSVDGGAGGSVTLTKTLDDNQIIWSGMLKGDDGSRRFIVLKRAR
jgi:hypothetical protein